MEQEVIERLTRVETKLDLALADSKMIAKHENDISFVKRVGSFVAFLITAAITYISGKHN